VVDYISRALVTDALAEWRALLRTRSTVSPLRDLTDSTADTIDLVGAHPGGLAPLFAGRATLLSSLVRDSIVYAQAAARGRRILEAAEHTMATTGTWTAALVVGTVAYEGVEQPLLLRPITLERARDDDLTITLRHEVSVNPVVATTIRERGGPADLAARAIHTLEGREFDPRPLWDEVRSLGDILPGVVVHERLFLGAFDDAEQRLLDDLDSLDAVIGASDVVAAIAGDADALTILSEPLPRWPHGQRDPFGERGLGDLDDAAFRIVDVVAGGRSVAVDAPAGSDPVGLAAAIVADAAAMGRTAAVVGGADEVLAGVEQALTQAGAGAVAISGLVEHWHADARSRLLESLTLDTPDVDEDALRQVGEELVRARTEVAARYDMLHRPRRPWGASAFEAVQAIVRLTTSTPAPGTDVRLSPEAGAAVAEHGLSHVTAALVALLHGTEVDVPSQVVVQEPSMPRTWWINVAQSLEHGAALDEALAAVVRLLPTIRNDVRSAAQASGLDVAPNVRAWREQVELFLDVQETLDSFTPAVYHRSLTDLVVATAPHGEAGQAQMSRSTRRALVRRAVELMRPGRDHRTVHVGLVRAVEQAERWREHCSAGGWPVVPDDFGAYASRCARLDEAWQILQPVLGEAAGLDDADLMPLEDLTRVLTDLAEGIPGGLDRVPAAPAAIDLNSDGFAALIASLRERQASPEQIRVDLEFAWWAAAFDAMVSAQPELIETGALGQAVERFVELDGVFARMRTAPLMRAVADQRRRAIALYPEDARDLFATLMEGVEVSLRQVRQHYGSVVSALRPVVIARADQVPHMVPPTRCIDVLVVVGAQKLATAELIPALARAAQVVVIADPVCATGSAVMDLGRLLPHVALRALPMRRDVRIGQVLRDLGYGQALPVLMAPGELEQSRTLRAIIVDAVAQPVTAAGIVESTRAEVTTAEQHVMHAVAASPGARVVVVAGNATHAARVRDALSQQHVGVGTTGAAVQVVGAGDAVDLSADEVVITVGYARDQRGVAPADTGVFGSSGGAAALAQALLVSQGAVTVISALDAHRLRTLAQQAPEGNALAGLAALMDAEQAPILPPQRTSTGAADWLLADVARLLRGRGCQVQVRYGVGGQTIPMVVAGPDGRGPRVAVVTDEPVDGVGTSLRDRVRWQYRRLEVLGWAVVSLWTVDVFVDPQGAADAVWEVLAMLPKDDAATEDDAAAEGDLTSEGEPTPADDAPEVDADTTPEPSQQPPASGEIRRTPVRGVDRPLIPTRAWEDEDAAWGDRGGRSRDDDIKRDRPPHW